MENVIRKTRRRHYIFFWLEVLIANWTHLLTELFFEFYSVKFTLFY